MSQLRLIALTLLPLAGLAAPARAIDKPYPTSFGVSSPLLAAGNSITATYYGWEETTVFGHTIWAFSAEQYAQNLANECFWWQPGGACASVGGTSLFSKPVGASISPYLAAPMALTFGWAAGEEIIFALMVDQGDGFNWFFSGDPARNGDGYAHLAFFSPALFPDGVPGDDGEGLVDHTAGKLLFGFEDVHYDPSDWDFNNAIFAIDAETVSPPQEVVPEPATLTLLASGLAGIGALRRRRRTNPGGA